MRALGEIHGSWKIYSSEFLELYRKTHDDGMVPDYDPDEENWDLESGQMGTLKIGKYMKLSIYDFLYESSSRQFKAPDAASREEIKSVFREDECNHRKARVNVTFLGRGMLELRIGENSAEIEGWDEVYFAGVLEEDQKSRKIGAEHLEREDNDNSKRLKTSVEDKEECENCEAGSELGDLAYASDDSNDAYTYDTFELDSDEEYLKMLPADMRAECIQENEVFSNHPVCSILYNNIAVVSYIYFFFHCK